MLLNALVGFALATSAIAAPFTESSLNSTKWTPDYILQPDEVILYGDGRMEVVHKTVYEALIEAQGLTHRLEEQTNSSSHEVSPNGRYLNSRDSCHTTAVVTDRSETFVDWDVQMSPVVIGTGSGITISVASGYSVSNSVSVSAGLDLTFIKDKVGSSFGIDYSHTWTTSTSIGLRATVPNGYSGVMITKPVTTRKYGRVLTGCLGSQTQTGTFTADSHISKSYNGVTWIQGAITTCMKKEFPLTRCEGSGAFI